MSSSSSSKTPSSDWSPASSSSPPATSLQPAAYISFDVEMDGTNPMQNSMRSIGLALFVEKLGKVDSLYMNLLPRTGLVPNVKTMRGFWDRYPEQWRQVNQNPLEPSAAMAMLATWLRRHGQVYKLKWVARPACVDWMWLKCYYETFGPADKPDVGYYCHCLDSMLRAYFLLHPVLDKKAVLRKLGNDLPYTHHALDDAVYQGTIYMNLRKIFNVTKRQATPA